jgi:hypothetical protein
MKTAPSLRYLVRARFPSGAVRNLSQVSSALRAREIMAQPRDGNPECFVLDLEQPVGRGFAIITDKIWSAS